MSLAVLIQRYYPDMERIQKVIAASGHFSRREAEALIEKGKVTLNGKKVTEMGVKCDPHKDVLKVNGQLIIAKPEHQYVLFYKPRKCIVTRNDPEERKTIYDFMPKKFHHLKPVGRLDYDSEGLMLLTNDGELMNKLTHPRAHIAKEYEVKMTPIPSPSQLARFEKGIMLDGRKTLPVEAEIIETNAQSAWVKLVLREGRNRQIRRMCEAVGITVKTLVRTKVGPFEVKGLKRGECRLLPMKNIIL